MGTLIGGHALGNRIRLQVIMRASARFRDSHCGQYQAGAKAPRNPTQASCAETGRKPRLTTRRTVQPLLPELGMRPLHCGKPAVNIREIGILFGVCEGGIDGRAIQFVLKIALQPPLFALL
jgi:hypothetical protein